MIPIASYASVVIDPPDNFYKKNIVKCVSIQRNYYANGANGYIILKDKPGPGREVAALTNGTILYISFSYERNGEQWGVLVHEKAGARRNEWRTGWARMSDLAVVYDFVSFAEEHKDEFYNHKDSQGDGTDIIISEDIREIPDADASKITDADASKITDVFPDITPGESYEASNVIFWKWPGSGEIVKTHYIWIKMENDSRERKWLTPEYSYMDGGGREWGFIRNFYNTRNTWICLSDPSNKDIPAFNPPPGPRLWPPIDSDSIPPLRTGLSIPTIVIILSIASIIVIAGFAALILALRKPKKPALFILLK
jgi:hypothetical protein